MLYRVRTKTPFGLSAPSSIVSLFVPAATGGLTPINFGVDPPGGSSATFGIVSITRGASTYKCLGIGANSNGNSLYPSYRALPKYLSSSTNFGSYTGTASFTLVSIDGN